jgi:RNA polymerase-binding transcription factor DksA
MALIWIEEPEYRRTDARTIKDIPRRLSSEYEHRIKSINTHLRHIQEVMKAMDRGQYGECVRCGEDINEKRLEAVPWATMCIRCQEETEREAEHTSAGMVLAGFEVEETDL